MHWLRPVVLNRLRLYLSISAVGAITIAGMVTVPALAQNDPDPVLIVDPEAEITFTGSGWGHGVGLSQWGAYSRALGGQTSTDILGFYFEGTTLADNYGRPLPPPTPEPTPGPPPEPAVSIPVPESLESPVAVHLATTTTTTLTPTGLNRITIDNNNIAHNGQTETRAPANTPITFTHHNGNWHITINGTDICNTGCTGHTAQLLFASNTTVAISNTGRSYAHGRINLIPNPQQPNQFHITLDHLTANKYLNNHNLPTASPTQPPPEPEFPEDSIRVHLATTTATTLTPTGLNRITIDNNNIGQIETRAPAGTPITFTHHNGHWHITINGTDICNTGCTGHTAQLLFGLDTSVAVSNTGHSYRHGRINLIPNPNSNNQFYVVLDLLSMEEYLRGIAEIPGDWPTAAIESQVIAARSYAIAALERRRAADTWPHPFDLYSSTWDQVYIGDSTEMNPRMAPWVQAVENTAGQTLLHNGAKVQAFYSSSNGGHTERSNYVFHSDLAYLKAKPDPFDQQHSPHASWTRTYPVSTFNRWLDGHDDTRVGRLIAMETIGGLGESARMDRAQIRITGTNRTITISGNRLRARINTAASDGGLGRDGQLLSTRFTFSIPPATSPQDSPPNPDDPIGDPPEDTPDPGTPIDIQRYYSGVITGPDFCLNRSLGGPITYPFDQNGDGIADNCVLPRTRRASVARQNALEQLAQEFPEDLRAHMAEECLAGPATLGEPESEATDECSLYLNRQATAGTSSEPAPPPMPTPGAEPAPFPPTPTPGAEPHPSPTETATPTTETEVEARPSPAETPDPPTEVNPEVTTPDPPTDSILFYSGVITSPDFCLNRSLGGPITYPFDQNGDGIADNCVLPRTRRASVARQNALEQLARQYPIHFGAYLVGQCQGGKRTFGEPQKEAVDECAPYIDTN